MNTLAQLMSQNEADSNQLSVLDLIVEGGRMAREPSQASRAKEIVSEFINEVPGKFSDSRDAAEMISRRIAEIDRLLSEQLNEIMHNADFQRLESAWLGVQKLVDSGELAKDLKVKILPVGKKELLKDFERSAGFDQSSLFKMIYEEEFGTLGGSPFGVLVTDYAFGRSAKDVRLLEELSHVAAGAHAPLLAAPAADLFDMESFEQLGSPKDIAKIFESGELRSWRAFRESEDARYVVMAMPNTLMRLPYGPDTVPVEHFNFVEQVDKAHSNYLWGSAAWSLAQQIVKSYADYGWCAAIRGVEGGGRVEGLPLHHYRSLSGDVVVKCPTETTITDRREKELSDLGFLPLCAAKGGDYAVFFGGQTVHKAPVYNTEEANANAKLASMLPYMLAASRFAHYLKSIMRDKIGSFQSRSQVETFLNEWISNYVTSDDEAPSAVKAKYPLREASIQVLDVPGKPGSYRSVVFLRPHFQLEELSASIRLVADLPEGHGAK
jgi:type VI secretion system protein ImpC